MIFPDTARVIYDDSPLLEVICQLRFPTILKIDSGSPAEFQERIRREFPQYRLWPILPPHLKDVPAEVVKIALAINPSQSQGGRHEFLSEDSVWMTTLTKETITLRTIDYAGWVDFRSRFESVYSAFQAAYQPTHFNRVGLRYQDVISRRHLKIETIPWRDLLQPWLLGPLSTDFADRIDGVQSGTQIDLGQDGLKLRLQYGIAEVEDDEKKVDSCFMIDADFFTDKRTELADALRNLDSFNQTARNLFRACITDRLHAAMGPRDPSEISASSVRVRPKATIPA